MRNYRYHHQFRSDHRKYGTLVFYCLLLLVLIIVTASDFQSLLAQSGSGLWIIGLMLALIAGELYKINLYPDITTNEKGLGVEFLSFYIPVSWEDIESIHLLQECSYPEKFKEWFVRTKKLTPFHLLYGKFKSGNYVTGFVIHSELENVQQFLDEIKTRLPVDKYLVYYKT